MRHVTLALALLIPPLLNAQPRPRTPCTATPADSARYRAAAEYSRAERGDAVLVMKGGCVVYEAYHNGYQASEPHLLASGTKSFTGVMALLAQEDGLLTLDEPVSRTIPEWASDPQRRDITIRDMLTLTSGIGGGPQGRPPAYADAIKEVPTAARGERFQYGNTPYQIFGEVMRRKLVAAGKDGDVLAYLRTRLLDPIGLTVGRWQRGRDGNPLLPHGAYLTAREWAKFGQLVLQDGVWNGRQLLPRGFEKELFPGTRANPAYGLTWWLGVDVPPDVRRDIRQLGSNLQGVAGVPELKGIVMAAGALKQRLYVLPELDLVVVRLGRSGPRQFDDGEFLQRLVR
jgi:CubicO group peptidase (beta-lactamase class C family)